MVLMLVYGAYVIWNEPSKSDTKNLFLVRTVNLRFHLIDKICFVLRFKKLSFYYKQQRRIKSVSTSGQSDQYLRCLHDDIFTSLYDGYYGSEQTHGLIHYTLVGELRRRIFS